MYRPMMWEVCLPNCQLYVNQEQNLAAMNKAFADFLDAWLKVDEEHRQSACLSCAIIMAEKLMNGVR